MSVVIVFALLLNNVARIRTRADGTTRGTRGGRREGRGGRRELTGSTIVNRRTFGGTVRTVAGQSFILRTGSMRPLGKHICCMGSGAGFISLGSKRTVIRVTSGSPCPNPGKLNNVAMRNSTSGMRIGRRGGKGICLSVDMRNVFVSTAMGLMLCDKAGGTVIAMSPGFSKGGLAVGKALLPCSSSGIFRKAACWFVCVLGGGRKQASSQSTLSFLWRSNLLVRPRRVMQVLPSLRGVRNLASSAIQR